MKVKDLIEILRALDQERIIKAFDDGYGDYNITEVTGPRGYQETKEEDRWYTIDGD